MKEVDPGWSLDAVMKTFKPHASWRTWFTEAYGQAMESPDPEVQFKGWRSAAIILGDMTACLLCVFVSRLGLGLAHPNARAFLGNIDLCLMDMGLATPAKPGDIAVIDIGKPETFRREEDRARAWLEEQMGPFNGDVARAAHFAMRLTGSRLGVLVGPTEPSIEQLLDASLWQRVAAP